MKITHNKSQQQLFLKIIAAGFFVCMELLVID